MTNCKLLLFYIFSHNPSFFSWSVHPLPFSLHAIVLREARCNFSLRTIARKGINTLTNILCLHFLYKNGQMLHFAP